MKKMTLALSAVTGLAAATVAMAAPAAAVGSGPVSAGETVHMAVTSRSDVGAAPLSRCMVIDLTAGATREADRNPAKQIVPSGCP